MTDKIQQENTNDDFPDEEINLLDYWRVIWKWKYLIAILVFITILATAISSLSKTDIYQATAIISPVRSEEGGGGLSALSQQFGGLPGISLPASRSTSEIVNLLKSNIIREKMIERYNLLPVLFYESWDQEKKEWKREAEGGFSLNPLGWAHSIVEAVKPEKKIANPAGNLKDDGSPTIWKGIRTLNSIIKVNNNVKENTITISVEFYDPEMAARMVNYLLYTLTEHMSSEAKRIANTKRRYLEEQLRTTADPLIRQKIYNLISQQIETSMMSEMKEDFAFKVIDPPKAPDLRIKPNRTMMVMLSFVVSLFAGVFLAFFLEYIKKAKGNAV